LEDLRKEIIMMPVLLLILIPLGALVIYAVVFDLKQRRHGGAPGSHDISSAARMARANADARSGSGLGGDGGIGLAVRGGGGPVR
jgi:hypothetical protein